ncbi:MAG: carbon storage regulator CsrA [bacterium]
MLVLTRKLGETIVIGDDIVIKVVDIHGKQIRLGIEAPTEISIFRGEIYERIQQENKESLANTNKTKESTNSQEQGPGLE